jgi:hypothetical protein
VTYGHDILKENIRVLYFPMENCSLRKTDVVRGIQLQVNGRTLMDIRFMYKPINGNVVNYKKKLSGKPRP